MPASFTCIHFFAFFFFNKKGTIKSQIADFPIHSKINYGIYFPVGKKNAVSPQRGNTPKKSRCWELTQWHKPAHWQVHESPVQDDIWITWVPGFSHRTASFMTISCLLQYYLKCLSKIASMFWCFSSWISMSSVFIIH